MTGTTPLARARTWVALAVAWISVVAVLVGLGVGVSKVGAVSLAAAVVLLVVGATVYEPAAIPVLAMPALIVVQRVGGESTNLSVSDFALFAAFWPALFLAPRPYSRPMRALLWLSAIYQLSTLFTVIANPYRANFVEWLHEWLSVAAALVVGWAVGRAGYARAGIVLYLGACGILAIATCVQGATQLAHGDTGPVFLSWPFAMHKNFVGDLLCIAALVAYARPPWLRLPPRVLIAGFWLFAIAIAATQARQAIVGLGVAVLVLAFRRGQGVRHTRLVLLAVIPAAIFVVQVLHDQLASGNQFNSAYQRLTWFQQSIVVWNQNQWFGVGLRWWYTNRTGFNFQPPQAELEVLSSAGTIGLVGFMILILGSLIVLWRVSPAYGSLAFAVVLARFIQGQLDLYWVSIQTSVPFVIVGVCLGAAALAESGDRTPGDQAPAFELPASARAPRGRIEVTS